MTISSASSRGFSPQSLQIQGGNSAQRPSEAQMKAKMDELKKSDPELAKKMEKIQGRMQELQKSGVSGKDAMETIQKEFGKPSESEMKKLGGPPGGGGFKGHLDSGGSVDISSLLSGKTDNSAILKMLEDRKAS